MNPTPATVKQWISTSTSQTHDFSKNSIGVFSHLSQDAQEISSGSQTRQEATNKKTLDVLDPRRSLEPPFTSQLRKKIPKSISLLFVRFPSHSSQRAQNIELGSTLVATLFTQALLDPSRVRPDESFSFLSFQLPSR